MQDVSDKLLGQFVACLEQRLAAPEPEPVAAPAAAATTADAGAPEPAAPPSSQAPPPRPAPLRPPPPPAETLDLGSAVLPVLLKSYWTQALAAVVVVAVLRRLLRR
jgi:hypothetical protein